MTQTDPNKLRRGADQFLHNAVEYNRPAGSIEMSIERTNGHVRIESAPIPAIGNQPKRCRGCSERF